MDDQRNDVENSTVLTRSVALVVVGVVMAWPIYNLCYFAMGNVNSGLLFLLLVPVTFATRFGGAMVAGAGFFLPMKRPWLGAVVGFGVQVLVTLAIYFTDPPE